MLNMKNWFKKKIVEPLHNHDFTVSYIVGDFHKYRCKKNSCDEVKYTIETNPSAELVDGKYVWTEATTTVLTAEEAQERAEQAEASLRATMWLMDNVEPTYSAGREDNTDYKYKTENGQIVEK